MRCMRSAEYGVVHKRVTAETKQALKFGEAIHLALKFRYKYYGNEPMNLDAETRQHILLEEFFKLNPAPLGDHRTLGFAQEVISLYNQAYQHENFTILKTPAPDNKSIVEEGFAIPLGQVGNYKIVWKGRLDLGIEEFGSSVWTVDNKTTSIGGDYFLQEFFTSNQMKGYTWAMRHILGLKVKGVLINALICRKITKTGKGIEFNRAKFEYDDEALVEWQQNTLQLVADFIHSYQRGYFPMQTTQCIGKFGRCQYHEICTMAASTRMQWLNSEVFKDDIFDPLHDDLVDLDAIFKMELPANYQRIEPTAETATQMKNVLADLNLLNLEMK